MIKFGETEIELSDPLVLGLAMIVALLLVLILLVMRNASKSDRAADPVLQQMQGLGDIVRNLSEGQQRLAGGLQTVSDTQATAQSKMIQVLEARLVEVQRGMTESLHGSSVKTTRSLTELQERLATIDRAQSNIEKLSGDVLSLQDILSNKQTRGAFGEIQLNDIVSKALPPDAFTLQATLSNGKRADCLIHLPNPPGPIVVDSKFPLEAYEALRRAENPAQMKDAARQMRTALRHHIKDISQKYILDGETADGALMFLPSEAVYAELHANYPEVVREGFDARVWIVSPTTCMATLNTMRAILKDARMREQAGAIRAELGLLYKDVDRLGDRVGNLDRHFGQAAKDIEEIKISATKAGNRARKLDNFDFAEAPEIDDTADVIKLTPQTAPKE